MRRLFLLVFFVFASSNLFAEEIVVFCYYEYAGWFSKANYLLLKNEKGKSYRFDALFDKKTQAYRLSKDDCDDAERLCRGRTGEKGLDFNGIKGASRAAKRLYQGYMGIVSNHFPIHDDSFANAIERGMAAYSSMPLNDTIESDPILDDPTNFLIKFKIEQAKLQGDEADEGFFHPQFVADFNRSETEVYVGGEIMFGRKRTEFYDELQKKYIRSQMDRSEELHHLMSVILAALRPAIPESVNDVELKKRIGFALATRQQAFESVPQIHLQSHLVQKLPDDIIAVSHAEGMRNTVTVKGAIINLETDLKYLFEVNIGVSVNIGTFDSHREIAFDVLKNVFIEKEKIDISRYGSRSQ